MNYCCPSCDLLLDDKFINTRYVCRNAYCDAYFDYSFNDQFLIYNQNCFANESTDFKFNNVPSIEAAILKIKNLILFL